MFEVLLAQYYKSKFGGMKGNSEIKIHAVTFGILLFLIFCCSVSLVPLITALIIMGFNLYKLTNFIFQAKFNNSRHRNKAKPQKSKQIQQFEKRVKNAFLSNGKQTIPINRNYIYHDEYADNIKDLLSVKIEEYRRKSDITNEEMNNIRKLNGFLQRGKSDNGESIQARSRFPKEIEIKQTKNRRKVNLSRQKLQQCSQTVKDYLKQKQDGDILQMSEHLEHIDRFLSHCFSLILVFNHSNNPSAIQYSQFLDLVYCIDKRNAVPTRYNSNVPLLQIKKQLQEVKSRLAQLPDFSVSPSIFRFNLYIKYLQKDFPDEQFVMGDREKNNRLSHENCHIFRIEGERFYYNRYANIKTRCHESIILLVLFQLLNGGDGRKQIMRNLREIVISS